MNPMTHLRRNAVAYLALFVALGSGTALAAGQITGKDIAKNAVRAKHIKDGQVRGAEVADNSLTGADIDESTLKGLGGGTSGSSGNAGSASAAPLGPDSVGSAEVKDESLTGADLAADAVTGADVDESTLAGLPKVIASGYISGVGPLNTGDRCNAVMTSVPGVSFGDSVIITAGSLKEDVIFMGVASEDSVSYQACYTGSSTISLNGDVRYLVLRAQ